MSSRKLGLYCIRFGVASAVFAIVILSGSSWLWAFIAYLVVVGGTFPLQVDLLRDCGSDPAG